MKNATKEDILVKIGELNIERKYNDVMKDADRIKGKQHCQTWKEMEDSNTNDKIKMDSIKRFIELTRKPVPREDFKTSLLKNLTQITVQTEYRVLFAATLKK